MIVWRTGIVRRWENTFFYLQHTAINVEKRASQPSLKSARNDIKKGDYSGISKVKKILNDDYNKSGGEWMNDEEKKLIGKFKPKIPYEPMNFNLNLDITKNRLLVEQRREEMAISKVQDDIDRKKFLKKINSNRHTGNSGLAYLINPIEEI